MTIRAGRFAARLALSAAALAIVFAVVDRSMLVRGLRQIDFGSWLAIVVAFLILHWLSALKWRRFILLCGADVGIGEASLAYGTGLFANLCLPSLVGGDVVRAGLLMRNHRAAAPIVFGAVVDRLSDVFALTILATVGLILAGTTAIVDPHLAWVAIASPPLGVALAILIARAVFRLPRRRLPARVTRVGLRMRRAGRLLRTRPLAGAMGVAASLVLQAGFVALSAVIGARLELGLSFTLRLAIWPLAKVAAMIPVSLGGLGVRELAYATLARPFVDASLAATESLVWQSVLFAGGLAAGLLVLLISLSRKRER